MKILIETQVAYHNFKEMILADVGTVISSDVSDY